MSETCQAWLIHKDEDGDEAELTCGLGPGHEPAGEHRVIVSADVGYGMPPLGWHKRGVEIRWRVLS